jgi:hypothetical protein
LRARAKRGKISVMRSFFRTSALIVVFAGAASAAWRSMPRLALVRDAAGADSLYYYCAAAPAFVFRHAGDVYQAPVLADAVGNDTVERFFDAHKKYLEGRGGLKRLVAVGGVDAADVEYTRKYFGLAPKGVREIAGPPPRAARELSRDWVASEYVVVAPYVAAPTVHDVESAANAASIAAFLNAPLFYAEPEGLSAETLEYIAYLSPSKAVVVEIGDGLPPSVNAALKEAGARVVADLKSERDVVTYINDLTDPAPPVLCCFRGSGMAAPTALAAARYGGFVLEVPQSITALSSNAWESERAHVPESRSKLREPYVMPAAVLAGEQAIADEFYEWLEALGGTDPNELEYVLTFAPALGEGSLPYSFDRAIIGDTATPDERGAAPGRFVNAPAESLASFNLTSAYRALVFANPRPGRVTFCGVSYMAHNAVTCPYTFKDNYGNLHKVNEVLGCRDGGFDDPGVFDDLRDAGYDAVVHDSPRAGSGRHPFVPEEDLLGFQRDVSHGTGFFYCSSHGTKNGIYPLNRDSGIAANVPWGREDWPGGRSGFVDFEGDLFSYNRWNDMPNRSPGMVVAFNACSLASGEMNAIATRRLAGASISSYMAVGAPSSGWFWISFVNRLVTRNYTLGEALCFATAQVSEIFPAHRPGVDSLIRYVLVGDPFMVYYRPTWQPPTPASPGGDYGGHNPGGAGPLARELEARAGERSVTLSWRAATNRKMAGWNLYRAKGPAAAEGVSGGSSGPAKVNGELITGEGAFAYVDEPLENGEDYYYWVEAVEGNGRKSIQGPADATPAPDYGKASFALAQNYPNPVRGATTIVFVVPDGPAALTVYDMRGAVVRRLWEGRAAAGGHRVEWDGKGDDGAALPPGVYLYKLEAGGRTAVKRMILIR